MSVLSRSGPGLTENGRRTRLPNLPGAVRSLPEAINDHGFIVGKAVMLAGVTRAVRWAADTHEVSTLGRDYSAYALDISNAGVAQ